MNHLSRRQVVQGVGLVGLGLLAGCGRLPGQAQAPPRAIGFLGAESRDANWESDFTESLRRLGWVDGQSVYVEWHWTADRDELVALAGGLVQRPVDVIVTVGVPATHAARAATNTSFWCESRLERRASPTGGVWLTTWPQPLGQHRSFAPETNTIPIVQAAGGSDLVEEGLAARSSRPGGNVTGMTNIDQQPIVKRAGLLKESVPALSRIAVLGRSAASMPDALAAIETLPLDTYALPVYSGAELSPAFDTIARNGIDGLIVPNTNLTLSYAQQIIDYANAKHLPAIYERTSFATRGGLMAYARDRSPEPERAAVFVGKILRGTRPEELPLERPMCFDFVINLKTAQALGLTIPEHVLLQATEVLQ